MRVSLLVPLALLASGGAARAGCYDLPQTRVLRPYADASVARQVTVVVDQTTYLPELVQRQVIEQVSRLATAGTEVSLGSFSSYSGTRFPTIETTVRFERGLPASLDRSVTRRGRDVLRACIAYTQRRDVARLQQALLDRFQAARPGIGRSDILSSVQQFGAHLRASSAPDKILLIVSDTLENSSTTSFYRAGRPRAIDPAAELRKVVAGRLVADLARARVYVVGAALVPGDETGGVPSELVGRLESFWTGYLRRSNASVVRIGKPLLLEDVR